MKRNVIETVMGGVVLLVAALFLVFAYTQTTAQTVGGYPIIAKFIRADGLGPGTPVQLGGIKIGTVTDLALDRTTYQAVVTMNIDPQVQLPTDSSARILPDGLLGANFVDISPGSDEEMLAAGARIAMTQDAINIVDLLGRFIFSVQQAGEDGAPQ